MRKSLVGIIVLLGVLAGISAGQLTTIEVVASADPSTAVIGQSITVSMTATNATAHSQKTAVYLSIQKPNGCVEPCWITIASIPEPFHLQSGDSVTLTGQYTPDTVGIYTVWGVASWGRNSLSKSGTTFTVE